PSQPPFYPKSGEREIGRAQVENILREGTYPVETREISHKSAPAPSYAPARMDGYTHQTVDKKSSADDVRASLRNNLGKIRDRNSSKQTRNATTYTSRKRGQTR
ncbi:hypothetical protein R6G69_07750, partial [Actinotignum urinale]|uniref:hypothetical protein n=1 Tax=Actinotignum urinale TaxID=190146 RepID=UPI002A813D71